MNIKVLQGIQRVMGILAILFVVGAIVAFILFRDWQQLFWGMGFLILALNMGIGFLLMRINLRRLKRQ